MKKFDPNSHAKLQFLAKAMLYRPDVDLQGPLEVNLKFYFQRPKGHYGRRDGQLYLRPDAPVYVCAKKKWDKDNLTKFVYDALMGPFWSDDGIIARGTEEKLWTDKLPRTEVEIKTLSNERNQNHGT